MKIYLKFDVHVLIYNKMSTSEWEKEQEGHDGPVTLTWAT